MNIVIGLGEVGKPLLDMIRWHVKAYGRDIENADIPDRPASTLHICYPYSDEFADITADYIKQYQPKLCIIHSTVVPGTTEAIEADCLMAYSPVRGRHLEMHFDLKIYNKFVAGTTREALSQAVKCLNQARFNVVTMTSIKALELAKLIETTYSGLLITFAQELERFCQTVGVDREEVLDFTAEVEYLPDHLFHPGVIGGHCIISNTYLMDAVKSSAFVDAIRDSNELRKIELGETDLIRYKPKRLRDVC